jgi:hypothetical protein
VALALQAQGRGPVCLSAFVHEKDGLSWLREVGLLRLPFFSLASDIY